MLSYVCGRGRLMEEDRVEANLKGMDDLDFIGWNNADWYGVFAHHHTQDVVVDWKGQAPTHGINEHPIAFGSGAWTCVVGEFEDGGRMVTVAKWLNGAITEEYIWA
jgi:hypothetical protein